MRMSLFVPALMLLAVAAQAGTSVSGRVVDPQGHAVPAATVKIETSSGFVLSTNSDAEGRYRFVSIKPGAYPWGNHYNAWRPQHIHFSLFGAGLLTRLVTQMYFPGDPLMTFDPIFNCTADEQARQRLISVFDREITMPLHALGYRFDIILSGREATPFESQSHRGKT